MNQFLLLLKGKKQLDYSEKELQKRLDEYRDWLTTIEDKYVSDKRLERTGIHIKNKKNIHYDGPFLESKEIIAGYIIIKAEDMNKAERIALSCPLLNYFEIYVRPII